MMHMNMLGGGKKQSVITIHSCTDI